MTYDLSLLLLLAGVDNRAVEWLKTQLFARLPVSAEVRAGLASTASILIGIVLALALQLNMVARYTDMTPLVGQIITGAAIGGGSNVIHWLADFADQKANQTLAPKPRPSGD